MARFQGMILLAEMRTGSNALEETLNQISDLQLYGEAFNPGFITNHDRTKLFGTDMAAREDDPIKMLRRMVQRTEGMAGFRFFHDHDPRVSEHVLPDPSWAKVILSRTPAESYVSRKIASKTDQWRLTDDKDRITARIAWDRSEFEAMLVTQTAFQDRVESVLRRTGQTAFHIDYSEIADTELLNGLARWLGLKGRLDAPADRLKRQNPGPLEDKVTNPEQMKDHLAELAAASQRPTLRLQLHPNADIATGVKSPLMHIALGAPGDEPLRGWLANLDQALPRDLPSSFDSSGLRRWRNRNKDGRVIAVTCHPVARAWHLYCTQLLGDSPVCHRPWRTALIERFNIALPDALSADATDLREGFIGTLEVMRKALDRKTSMSPPPYWYPQMAQLAALSEMVIPDHVFREAEASEGLAALVGATEGPDLSQTGLTRLEDIYSDSVEDAVRALYNTDISAFGYRRWRGR